MKLDIVITGFQATPTLAPETPWHLVGEPPKPCSSQALAPSGALSPHHLDLRNVIQSGDLGDIVDLGAVLLKPDLLNFVIATLEL